MKVCHKTCIFFFFPIIYKYLCMAKRSLLSRCPSDFVLCTSWIHKDVTELRDSCAEGIVIFQYSIHLCQQCSSMFERGHMFLPGKIFSLSSAATGARHSALPCHPPTHAVIQRTKHVNIWWCEVRTTMGAAALTVQILWWPHVAHSKMWRCPGGATLPTFFVWNELYKGEHSGILVFWIQWS